MWLKKHFQKNKTRFLLKDKLTKKKLHIVLFALKKIVSFFHLLVKIPFGMGLSDHSPKKLSYFIILIISFKIIRACRLVTLICGKQHIIICLNILVLLHVYVKTHSILKNIHFTFVHDIWLFQSYHGFQVTSFQFNIFVSFLSWLFFLLSFYSISLFKLVFLYSAMILRLI